MSYSPVASPVFQITTFDDPFDHNFSFIDTDYAFDLLASPFAKKSPLPDMSGEESSAPPSNRDDASSDVAQPHFNVPASSFSLSPLSLAEAGVTMTSGSMLDSPPPPMIPDSTFPYSSSMSYSQPSMGFYHPYARNMQISSRSPPTPMSLPLSSSPPGSAGSHHNHSPHGISPSIVTPMTNLSPASEAGVLGWGYSPPYGHPLPPPPIVPSMAMVSGFPYPIHPPPMSPRPPRPPLKILAKSKNRASEHDLAGKDGDDEELQDLEDEPMDGGALGFRPELDEQIPAKPEAIRRARIESEQRRRTELRQGFDRLRDALPASNQRASKATLLDRAVAHVQSIEAANRYLVQQNESLAKQCEELRRTNQQLVATMAARSTGSSPSAPPS